MGEKMDISDDLGRTFYGILGYDAVDAMNKMGANDSQSARRDFVRTAFAAIEGWLWNYRQEVRSTLSAVRELSALEESAFAETSYAISDTGRLREQMRFTSMATMFRFVTRLAEEQYGEQLVDFGSSDWKNFIHAIAIRNRVTHPKSITDLTLPDFDIATVKAALLWFFEMVVTGSEKLKFLLDDHLNVMREVSDAIAAGDPATLELYNSVLESRNN
jgi:hypothetical protein